LPALNAFLQQKKNENCVFDKTRDALLALPG
jgi:hypothetical protein